MMSEIAVLEKMKSSTKWMRVVLMKQFLLAFLCIILAFVTISSHGQVVPAATKNHAGLSAGGVGSIFQPDYAGEGIAQTSPNRLYGAGAFFDMRFSQWAQIEGEGRWLHFNKYLGIDENTYLIGPRLAPCRFHGITPYGKVLFGLGNGSFLTGNTFVLAYGGGVDYRLSRRFTLRAFDFEYQQWRVTPTLWPYGGSAGLSFRIF